MVSPVIFSPDGAMVVAGGDDGTIAFYNATTGEERRRITRDNEPSEPIVEIRDLAWSADGLTLAAGGTERFDRDKAEMMGQAYFSTKIGRVVLYEATGKARIMKRTANGTLGLLLAAAASARGAPKRAWPSTTRRQRATASRRTRPRGACCRPSFSAKLHAGRRRRRADLPQNGRGP